MKISMDSLCIASTAKDLKIKGKKISKIACFLSLFSIVYLPATVFGQSLSVQQVNGGYTFTLNGAATTSAGIYRPDSTLIRTLWTTVKYNAGTYPIQWDGKDDNGVVASAGQYIAKVVSNNVQYVWLGVVGNTSANQTGSSVHRSGASLYSMNGMTIVNGVAFFCSGYSEGFPSVACFLTSAPQKRVNVFDHSVTTKYTNGVCTDGTRIYQDGFDPYASDGTVHSWVSAILASDNSDVTFSSGINFKPTYARQESAVGLLQVANSTITGRAVQKKGNFLVIARSGLNSLYIFNKLTGALINTITSFVTPKTLCIDGNDNLWISSGVNTIGKYVINFDGSLTSSGISVVGITDPGAIAVTPDNSRLFVVDYNTQQVKFFSNSSGAVDNTIPTLGQSGGYTVNSAAAPDKFCFKTANDLGDGNFGKLITYFAFDSDGSFWMGDPGNYRNLHFSSAGKFIEEITYQYSTYSTNVDYANNSRVFAGWNEFSVDYSQPLTGSTGWRFTNNWGVNLSANYNQLEKFKSVHTFISGGVTRTFAFVRRMDGTYELAELQSSGVLRLTGVVKNSYIIDEQGRLTVGMYRYAFNGFDNSNNATWSTVGEMLADVSKISPVDPLFFGGFQQPAVTTTNKVIFYQSEAYINGSTNNYVKGFHLGAINKGGNTWSWLTQHATNQKYMGEFPTADAFDIGNNVNVYAGSVACVSGRNIVTGYHGEFWKLAQTNKFNHFLDNGLAVGQFGITRPDAIGDAPALMAGNALTSQLIAGSSNDIMYLWHGDESYHAGVHLWKISGLNTIQEKNININYPLPSLSPDSLPGIDLLAGLPFQAVVPNNVNGWIRNNPEDYTQNSSKWYTVATGVKSFMASALDVYMYYRQPVGIYTVQRTLSNTATLTSWSVNGKLDWDGNYTNPTDGSAGSYVEVLDNAGKIISRIFSTYTIASGVFSTHIYGNDKVIVEDLEANLLPIVQHPQPFEMSANAGILTFSYAGNTTTTKNLIDPTANWAQPATLRFYFWTNAGGQSNDRIIDLQAARFVANKAPQTITFNTIPTQNNVTPFTLIATASSNLPITYTIVSGPATVSGNTITITGPGTVKVQADQAGNSIYGPAQSVTQSFLVGTVRVDL